MRYIPYYANRKASRRGIWQECWRDKQVYSIPRVIFPRIVYK